MGERRRWGGIGRDRKGSGGMGRNGEGHGRQGVRKAQKVSELNGKRDRQERHAHEAETHREESVQPISHHSSHTCLAIICMRAAVNVLLFTSSYHVKHVPYVGSPVVMSVFTN